MYRRPKFLEVLHEIRQRMAREADYDINIFAEIVRNGKGTGHRGKGKTAGRYIFEPLILEKVSKTKK